MTKISPRNLPSLGVVGDLFQSFSQFKVKNFNKRVSLDLIRFTPGGISRAELSRQLGISRSAISTIVTDLLAKELVREAGQGPTTGGRHPLLLEINPKRGHVVGIDMGATHLSILVSDLSTVVLDEIEIPFDIRKPPQDCLQIVHKEIEIALERNHLTPQNILAMGLAVPGPVAVDTGSVIAPPIMPGWDNYPIRSMLETKWDLPVSLDNDADLGALGEWSQGAGRGEHNLAYIKVGTGVGAGLLLNRTIYHGETGGAGEIGHITIKDKGPRCSCGNFGCLEALAGGLAIAQKARAAVLAGRRTQLATIEPAEQISAKDVSVAARLGDLVAQQIISEAGEYLGIAIANLVNLINPGMVIVGGGVAQIGDLLLDPIRQIVQERSLRSSAMVVRVNAALLGRRSTSMGAVVQAIDLALDRIIGINGSQD